MGSVLLADPTYSENIEATAIVYMGKCNNLMRNSARYFCACKTNISHHALMRQVFRNLRGSALDPKHLAFALEASTWAKDRSRQHGDIEARDRLIGAKSDWGGNKDADFLGQ